MTDSQESYRRHRSPWSQHAGICAETIENLITELRRRNYGVAYIRAVRTLHPTVFACIYMHTHTRAHHAHPQREI